MSLPGSEPAVAADWPACCASATDRAALLACLRRGLAAIRAEQLPLAGACVQGGWVDGAALSLSLLDARVTGDGGIDARIGAQFVELVGGCNCHDDPAASAVFCVIGMHWNAEGGPVRWRLLDD